MPTSLTIGDPAPNFRLCGPIPHLTSSEQWNGRELIDKPLVIFFYEPESLEEILGFRDCFNHFQNLGVNLVGVSLATLETQAELIQQHHLPFLLLGDSDAQISTAFDVLQPCIEPSTPARLSPTTFVLNTNRRIIKLYHQIDPHTHPLQVLEDIQQWLSPTPAVVVTMQAPVLIIPDVFPREVCRELIQLWETGHTPSPSNQQEGEEVTAGVNYQFMRRQEHRLKPGKVKERVKQLICQRVQPEILKVFNFAATRFEDLAIVCYDAADGGGYLRPHRDNEVRDATHRRFAITINLNSEDYEGAYLRFPEYGSYLYRPCTGSAMVFSTSVLHEVTDVTQGRRFTLFGWLHSEQETSLSQLHQHNPGEMLLNQPEKLELLAQLFYLGIAPTPTVLALVQSSSITTLEKALAHLRLAEELELTDCPTGFLIKAISNNIPVWGEVTVQEQLQLARQIGLVQDLRLVNGKLIMHTPEGEIVSWEEFTTILRQLDIAIS